jgi:hypothetical protein
MSGRGVSSSRQSLQTDPLRVPECVATVAPANLCFTSSMDEYKNPYHDDPELAPLTRVGRVMECAVAVLLALLAIYVSR